MTMTVTTINYSDIDLAILRECFEKSKPYMEAEKPNIIWEEFGLTRESTDDEKFEKLREYFENAGGKNYLYIPCLNTNPMHIDMMSTIIEKHTQGWSV